jgi:stage V sporulation protein SpoVS
MIKFKGKKVYIPDVGIKWIPTAVVSIRVGNKKYICEMLVDSGADITLIPRKFGEELGLIFKEDEVKEIRGIGEGAVPYIVRQLRIAIGRYTFPARIGWVLIEEIPFILGRLDVFDKFNIEFKQSSRITIF